VDVSIPCGASVDKRKELAEALRELDANPMRKKRLWFDLERHLSTRNKGEDVPIQEALTDVRKELGTVERMHNSASRKPSKAACIAATVFPAAYVDKRKELADALHDLDANPRATKTMLMDLKKRLVLSTRIRGIPLQEAFNNVRKELETLQQMHNSASRKPSNAACIAATGVPAAHVDKRKELADALHALDADSRKNKTLLFVLKREFALSTIIRGEDVSIHEAFNNVRTELVSLQRMYKFGFRRPRRF